jgi:hypothetical protein
MARAGRLDDDALSFETSRMEQDAAQDRSRPRSTP